MGGPVGDAAVIQATTGVKEGGLGFRRARDLALPAYIASRLEARWIIQKLCEEEAFLKILGTSVCNRMYYGVPTIPPRDF